MQSPSKEQLSMTTCICPLKTIVQPLNWHEWNEPPSRLIVLPVNSVFSAIIATSHLGNGDDLDGEWSLGTVVQLKFAPMKDLSSYSELVVGLAECK
jgi:hypothetical protein